MPAIMAGSRSKARTMRNVITAKVKSILSTFHSRSIFAGLAEPDMALMTTAASTASGSHWKAGARKARVSSTPAARKMLVICVFAPAPIAADDFERLPVVTMPPSSPAPMFAKP